MKTIIFYPRDFLDFVLLYGDHFIWLNILKKCFFREQFNVYIFIIKDITTKLLLKRIKHFKFREAQQWQYMFEGYTHSLPITILRKELLLV